MKIKIISNIKQDIERLTEVKLVFSNEISYVFPLAHIKTLIRNKINFVEVPDAAYTKATLIQWKLFYDNNIQAAHPFLNNELAIWKREQIVNTPITHPAIRERANSPFRNTIEDKNRIFDILDQKINDITKTSNKVSKGLKNLVYYTVWGEDYVSLMELSLKSIIKNSKVNFDILIICDNNTQKLIQKLKILNNFTYDFHIIPAPLDGVEASINKFSVFDYKHIDNYRKILFLDCDILVANDMQLLFDSIVVKNKLLTVYNPIVKLSSFLTLFHGVRFRSEEIMNKAEKTNILPFNAGQFAFINSSYMRKHFDNVRWFINNWPSIYFFEQSFANIYFVRAEATIQPLQRFFSLTNANTEVNTKKHGNDVIFIHFIAPPLNGKAKLKFINQYKAKFLP